MLDLGEASLLDVAWWRRSNALISAMARQDEKEAIWGAYFYQLALIAHGGLAEDSFKGCQKTAKELFQSLLSIIEPWNASADNSEQKQLTRLTDLYKELIGDPDDPVFQEKLAEDVRRMNARPAEPVETDEARVARLYRELAKRRQDRYRAARKKR